MAGDAPGLLRPGRLRVTSFYERPTQSEINAYRFGPVTFALAVAGSHVLVIAVQYGELPWVDMPFEVHRIAPERRGVPTGDPYDAVWIRSVLVDASTGVVQALRIDAVDGEFACGLRAAVWEQLETARDDDAAAQELHRIRAEYPTSELLALHRAEERARGIAIAGGDVRLSVDHY